MGCSSSKSQERIPERQTVVVLRHSERKDQVDPTYKDSEEGKQWPFDPPLTENGIELAKQVASEMAEVHAKAKFSMIVSSPYKRCMETAAEVAKSLKLPVLVDQEMGEVWEEAMPSDRRSHRSPIELVEMMNSLCIDCANPDMNENGIQFVNEKNMRSRIRQPADEILSNLPEVSIDRFGQPNIQLTKETETTVVADSGSSDISIADASGFDAGIRVTVTNPSTGESETHIVNIVKSCEGNNVKPTAKDRMDLPPIVGPDGALANPILIEGTITIGGTLSQTLPVGSKVVAGGWCRTCQCHAELCGRHQGGIKLLGNQPKKHGETLEQGHKRCIVRVEMYIEECRQLLKNVVIVTHAPAVAALTDLFQGGKVQVRGLEYCAYVAADRAWPVSTDKPGGPIRWNPCFCYADTWNCDMKSVNFDLNIDHTDENHEKYLDDIKALVERRKENESELRRTFIKEGEAVRRQQREASGSREVLTVKEVMKQVMADGNRANELFSCLAGHYVRTSPARPPMEEEVNDCDCNRV